MPTVTVPPEAHPMRLSDWLSQAGHSVPAPCGGRGICGKCRVQVVSGVFPSATEANATVAPDADGCVLACQVLCPPDGAVVRIDEDKGSGLVAFAGDSAVGGIPASAPSATGVALDIGTTTLAAALVRLSDGGILATASALNPQYAWGADVINRIGACSKGHLADQQKAVVEATRGLLADLAAKAPDAPPPLRLAVVGNPTMLHLFAGISPEGIGRYPFTPAFLERRELSGAQLGLPIEDVVLLPSASSFIGSDVMGGVLTCRMADLDEPSVLMDIGTNGEMVLCTGKRRGAALMGVSAAAGPALEGANISCGMGGVSGAVCRVRSASGELRFQTIGDAAPLGLCGCGLVDFIAHLLRSGTLDETGSLDDEPCVLSGVHETNGGALARAETPVALTQQDIREFQLAKSAMRAGLEALLAHEGVEMADVKHLFIAGGLGYYLDGASAARTGLLPEELLPVVETVGNSSLAGAVRCLAHPDALREIEDLAARCGTFELNTSSVFNEAFVEQMLFPEDAEE